jgi:protein SCO1/2
MIPLILERFGVTPRSFTAGAGRSRAAHYPNVRLQNHRNETVRFYDDVLAGKVVVMSFMYTRCKGTCPPTITSLRKLQQALGTRAGRDVFLYSITLDPAYDTPEVLNGYARTVDAGPAWDFLTGGVEDVDVVRRKLGVVDPDPRIDADKSQHSGLLLFGNEPADRWAACPAPFATERLLKLLSRVTGRRTRTS